MSVPAPVVLEDGPYADFEGAMEFRLTYEGPLMAWQPAMGMKRADHKHEIRKVLHAQLKRLWSVTRFLREWEVHDQDAFGKNTRSLAEDLARDHLLGPYRFAPLVTERFSLLCGLHILFLRADPPGSAVSAGDIDNRIKTIIDALRKPTKMDELGKYSAPEPGEDPFYVLLEDDRLIDKLAIETDNLLEPTGKTPSLTSDARLIISVRVKPQFVSLASTSFF